MFPIIQNNNFYKKTNVVYPPFKNGYYMEEFFFHFMQRNEYTHDKQGRRYIPALWTNFQIEEDFRQEAFSMQQALDQFVRENPSPKGYFIVVQHDDGPMLRVPQNTHIYGACTGHSPLPLIYEDNSHRLLTIQQERGRSFHQKTTLCSFVGTITHDLRKKCFDYLAKDPRFKIHLQNTWTNKVGEDAQTLFINETLNSKFALAPRGNGRSSFRFFEIFLLGSIPVYIWDDKDWLPYQDVLDYDKFCVSIHESEIDMLDTILENINEKKYNAMLAEYQKIKHIFELEYMCEYITGRTDKRSSPIDKRSSPMDNPIHEQNIPDTDSITINFNTNREPEPPLRVAIVIFVIGEKYTHHFNQYFKKGVVNYCKKHGYDLIVRTELIKTEPNMDRKKFFWQRLLLPETYSQYDYVVSMDSDIYIGAHAPALPFHEIPDGHVAAVNERKYLENYHWRERIQHKAGWERTGKEWYALSGHKANYNDHLNGGLVIYQPKHHATLFSNLYKENLPNYQKYSQDDQSFLSIYLMENNKIHWLDPCFNRIWFFWKELFYPNFENLLPINKRFYLKNYMELNYFCHFTGGFDVEWIEP